MNMLHLEYFYTVASEGGFLKASARLRIQQPAISRMVSQLEDYFGFKLFEKIGRNVQLTPRGDEVYEHCRRIFGEVELLKTSVGKISGECKGQLLIAASEPIASHFLPEKISLLLKSHPAIYPNIFSGPSSLMIKEIEKGDVELGFFFHTPALNDKVIVYKELDIPFRLVIHKDYKKKEEVLNHFIGSREIDDLLVRKFPTLEKLKAKYPKATIKTSSNNLTAHKEMVLRGVGVSVLPEFLIREELKTKVLVDVLPLQKFSFKLKILKRKHAELTQNAMALLSQSYGSLG